MRRNNNSKPEQHQSLVGQLKRCVLIVACLIASIFIFSVPVGIITSSARQNLDKQKIALQVDLDNILIAMIDQETGLRGYINTDNKTLLQPFTSGRPQYLLAVQDLKAQAQSGGFKDTATALAQVEEEANAWYSDYAEVQIQNVQSGKLVLARSDRINALGKGLFNKFRASIPRLQNAIQQDSTLLQSRLGVAGSLTFFGALLLAVIAIVVLWRTVVRFFRSIREQLKTIRTATNLIGSGDLSARIEELAYEELNSLGQTFNAMADKLAIRSRELEHVNDAIRQQRDELVTLNTDLEEANRVRSQFLSTMSHELRTPLASIIGFSQLLLDDAATADLSQAQRANLERVLKNGQHLLGLVNDVLDLEKIEAGRMDITYAQLDVRELLTSVVEEMQSIAMERNLDLRADVAEGADWLESNPVKLHQILVNLVSNALRFTRQGKVTVSATRLIPSDEQADCIAIAVKDTGIGIPLDLQGRIFEAFYQVDGGYTRKSGGTGLGLSIVSKLTMLLGGKLEVTSTPEQGSTFTVILPIKPVHYLRGQDSPRLHPAQQEKASPLSNELSTYQEAAGEKHNLVLAVDDNPDVVVLLKDALRDTPYTVIGVQDPVKVMELVQKMHPSAITLNVMMPDVNGWQILHQLKANPATASIPVVMLTVLSEPAAAYILGADDYLVKPFEKSTLLNTLQRLIKAKKDFSHTIVKVTEQVYTRNK